MFTAGPRSTASFSCCAESAIASPTFSIRSLSKEQAVAQAGGKQTALMLSFTPRLSCVWSCLRSP